jgi:hypothetical protein
MHASDVAGPRAIVARVAAGTLIAIGYVDLARGGTVVAPVALVIGYVGPRARRAARRLT